jgi:hypothetical protein
VTDCGAVYVHVGVPKTGTTFLQRAMRANRPALRDSGFLYPGPRVDHFFPALDLMGRHFHGEPDGRTHDAWPRLVQRLRDWCDQPGRTALISHEILAAATDEDVARLVSDLSFTDVHLVLTLRDPARQLVAVWQENVKNRATRHFAPFFQRTEAGADDPASASTGYWPYQDVPGILRRWSAHVPAARTHAATLPNPSASGNLWSRYLDLFGLDPDQYPPGVDSANTSLGVAETDLLIRLNQRVQGRLDWPRYERKVKFYLANEVLGPREARVPITLTEEEHAWAVAQAELMTAAVERHVGNISGDLHDLHPAPWRPPPVGLDRDDPSTDAVLDAALDALAGLLIMPEPPPTPPPPPPSLPARVRNKLRRHR